MRRRIMTKGPGESQRPTGDSEVRYHGKNGQTVLAILQKKANLETIAHQLGVFVSAIDGIHGSSTAGWIFTKNGKSILKSAASVKTTNRDLIEWRLSSPIPKGLAREKAKI